MDLVVLWVLLGVGLIIVIVYVVAMLRLESRSKGC